MDKETLDKGVLSGELHEKLGMKLSDDVMEYNKIEWTGFTVE